MTGCFPMGDGTGEVADGGYDGENEWREMAMVQMATGFTISLGRRCWFRREEDSDDDIIGAFVGRTERWRRFPFRF
ncbi:hypothetical protein FXO37_32495 [Capsicum annuum]|nr:hypothetical protein FXO37_32495 [Capsicum annuum]